MDTGASREAFDQLIGQLRPKLHRYCARMTGSVIDGEDVVQEALLKALEAFNEAGPIASPEGWLFRIAHNAALDFLRRRLRQESNRSDEDPETMVDPTSVADDREIVVTSLRTFMRLPAAQRSSVILMDVLGYSLQQIGDVTSLSIPGVKAALHRGRARLRALAQEPDDLTLPVLGERERALLAAYVDRFNARDVDAVRTMLADEVRLDLVAKVRLHGRTDVSKYFSNYAKAEDWLLVPGLVEGRAAALVRDPDDRSGKPGYFVLLEWDADKLIGIRDFRFARYAVEGAEMVVL
ncbi:MAG TPA: sigma-70 family RNA polymerase sigma factor [Xanthobacteraceae bacterium]|jgi:RNA polymerase sigma-70 factor (ECF subfamily)